VLSGGVADRDDDQVQVALVQAGDDVVEADGVAGGEAGRDADDALLAAGCWQASGVESGDDGVPVDPGDRGPVADACRSLDVTGASSR